MIDKRLLERFWKDFYIVTQEERQDFPYANIADAAKSLIKGRNWIGTWTELIITKSEELNQSKRAFRTLEIRLKEEDRKLLKHDFHAPGYVLKNTELFRDFVWSKLEEEQKVTYHTLSVEIEKYTSEIEELESDKEHIELILKKLEKSTDWLVQYINWQKFELRGLQQ